MRYPTRLLSADEEILDQFRPHWKVLLPAVLWGMLIAGLLGVALAALAPRWRWHAVAVALLLWLLSAVRPLVRWWFTNYVLTSERIIARRGMIARRGREIPLENITNVLFSQGITERLLGYGDVTLEAAGSQGNSRIENVPDPEGFQSEVYAARELRSAALRGSGAAREFIAQLEALADLRERGHLTEEEFASRKAWLLQQAAQDERHRADRPGRR